MTGSPVSQARRAGVAEPGPALTRLGRILTGPGPGQRRPSAGEGRDPRRFGRFVVVGATNALVDLGAFNLFYFVAPTRNPGQLVLYNTAAVIAAMVNAYIWHSRWTFRDRAATGGAGRWRQRSAFAAQAALNIGINDGVLAGLAAALNAGQVIPATVANNAAKVLAMMTASLTSYVVMKLVVFRSGDSPPAHSGGRRS